MLHRNFLSLITLAAIAAMTTWLVTTRTSPSPGFSTTALQTRFISYATTLAPQRQLHIAKIQQTEVFERKSEARLFWDRLKLPDVVVSATVPVEYNYYVELNNTWNLSLMDQTLYLTVPPLSPATPAADISQLQFEVKKGSFFRDVQKVSLGLQSEMTELLKQRAQLNSHLARETARKELEKMSSEWLLKEGHSYQIKVQFADEESAGAPFNQQSSK